MSEGENRRAASGPAAQGGPASQSASNGQWPGSAMSGGAGQIGSAGSALPESTRAALEAQLGADLSDVKVLNNSCLPDRLGAKDFTVGTDIHFSSGAYQPHTPAGQKLLAHELSHVVQQQQGSKGAE